MVESPKMLTPFFFCLVFLYTLIISPEKMNTPHNCDSYVNVSMSSERITLEFDENDIYMLIKFKEVIM